MSDAKKLLLKICCMSAVVANATFCVSRVEKMMFLRYTL